MSYALFKTNQSTKILVELTESTNHLSNPINYFNTQNVPLAGLLPKEITLVDANIAVDTQHANDQIEWQNIISIYKPDIVIKNNDKFAFTMVFDNNSRYAYLEVNCDINQLDKYYSLFQLIQNYKSIKSQLNLN